MTVAVVTSTIARPQLAKCIASVAAQTYPCKHYVFVNGPEHHAGARKILEGTSAKAYYLHENTGDWGFGPTCNGAFAAIPHLTNADWIFYLNDDDFFDEDHVWSIVDLAQRYDLKWAYSLRKFVDIDDKVICEDNWNSLGHYPPIAPDAGAQFADNSCLAVSRKLAAQFGLAWSAAPLVGDRCMFAALKASGARYGTTGRYTTNYRIGTGTADGRAELYVEGDKWARSLYPQGFPWAHAQVFS